MAQPVASLSVDLAANVARLSADMNRARGEIHRTFGAIESSAMALKGVLGGLFAGVSAAAITHQLADWDKLDSALQTAVHSQEAAAEASRYLADINRRYQMLSINDLTEAYIKLRNSGIDPTEQRLVAFGNIAAGSVGKNLMQFVEAVADAVTGEFERLKEFGIKASQEGDKVSFTFDGVTTTVRKNAQEIGRYLEELGKTQFAGGLQNQADDVGTALARVENDFAHLVKTIGDAGAKAGITSFFDRVSGAVEALDKQITTLTSDTLDARIARLEDQLTSARRVLDQLVPLTGMPLIGEDADEMARREREIRNMEAALKDLQAQRTAMGRPTIPAVPEPVAAPSAGKSAAEQKSELQDRLAALKAGYDQQRQAITLAAQEAEREFAIETERAATAADRLATEKAAAEAKISFERESLRLSIAQHKEELQLVTDAGDRARLTGELNQQQSQLDSLLKQTGQSAELFGVKAANAAREAAREFRSVFDVMADKQFADVLNPDEFLRQRQQILDGTAAGRKMAADEEMRAARDALENRLIDAEEFAGIQERIQAGMNENAAAAQRFGMIFQSAFEDALVSGQNFADVMEGLLQDVARMILRIMVTEPLAKGISGMLSGFSLGGVTKLLGFADGGDPPVGVPSIVGERGPELFVPKVPGTIVPLKAGAAAAVGGNVVINIIDQSSDGGRRVETRRRPSPNGDMELDVMIREKVRNVIESGYVDGSLARATGGGRTGTRR